MRKTSTGATLGGQEKKERARVVYGKSTEPWKEVHTRGKEPYARYLQWNDCFRIRERWREEREGKGRDNRRGKGEVRRTGWGRRKRIWLRLGMLGLNRTHFLLLHGQHRSRRGELEGQSSECAESREHLKMEKSGLEPETGKGRDFWYLSKSPEPLKAMKAGMKLREDLTLLDEQMEHNSSHTTAPNDEQTIQMLSALADNSSPPGQAMVSAKLTETGFLREQTGRQQGDIGGPHWLVKCPDHWLPNKTNHQAVREHFPGLQIGWALGPWEAALLLTFEIIVKWKTHIPKPVAKNNRRQKVLNSSKQSQRILGKQETVS